MPSFIHDFKYCALKIGYGYYFVNLNCGFIVDRLQVFSRRNGINQLQKINVDAKLNYCIAGKFGWEKVW